MLRPGPKTSHSTASVTSSTGTASTRWRRRTRSRASRTARPVPATIDDGGAVAQQPAQEQLARHRDVAQGQRGHADGRARHGRQGRGQHEATDVTQPAQGRHVRPGPRHRLRRRAGGQPAVGDGGAEGVGDVRHAEHESRRSRDAGQRQPGGAHHRDGGREQEQVSAPGGDQRPQGAHPGGRPEQGQAGVGQHDEAPDGHRERVGRARTPASGPRRVPLPTPRNPRTPGGFSMAAHRGGRPRNRRGAHRAGRRARSGGRLRRRRRRGRGTRCAARPARAGGILLRWTSRPSSRPPAAPRPGSSCPTRWWRPSAAAAGPRWSSPCRATPGAPASPRWAGASCSGRAPRCARRPA